MVCLVINFNISCFTDVNLLDNYWPLYKVFLESFIHIKKQTLGEYKWADFFFIHGIGLLQVF